jgi:hypothetical protein
MAKIFEHLQGPHSTGMRYPNEWIEPTSYLTPPKLVSEDAYMQEYEMRLEHLVRFRIVRSDEKPYAQEAAERRLKSHLYGEQLILAERAIDTVHSGASRREVIEVLIRLKESMS